jgi:TP53 regulating kinase-like protein
MFLGKIAAGDQFNMLVKKGAEAYLFREEWYGLPAIRKCRVPKSYRVPELDYEIRRARTAHEARLMYEACRVGVSAPSIYFVDLDETTIIMEYIEGDRVKDVVNGLEPEKLEEIFLGVGKKIALLHKNGIIHGDLTTSNMILTSSGKVFFVDFGLGEFSSSVEDEGVDLHLMRRALESTHYRYSVRCFDAIINGYKANIGESLANNVLRRIREIELRGRYFKRGTDDSGKNKGK